MKETSKIFGVYILIIIFILVCGGAFGQVQVTQFNAEWNKTNEVPWLEKLTDCQTISFVDINTQKELQKKHKIAVIPTIIIFKDDVKVARFQADLSFKMLATREDVQEVIDEIIMSDF